MLLSAVSVLVVAQSSSEIPEGLMNNPVYVELHVKQNTSNFRLSYKYPVCSAVMFATTNFHVQ